MGQRAGMSPEDEERIRLEHTMLDAEVDGCSGPIARARPTRQLPSGWVCFSTRAPSTA